MTTNLTEPLNHKNGRKVTMPMPQVGSVAPGFTLYDQDKKLRSLSEFLGKGRKTILAFYPGAFTGVCDKEMCAFRDMFSDLQKLNGQLVGVSVDAPFAQKAFAEKYNLNFPLLSDFKREVIENYGLTWKDLGGVSGYNTSNRAILILDDAGKVTYAWTAPNPGVLPDFDAIKKNLA
jgi:glutaredoxin-dependent peroxiredoxin